MLICTVWCALCEVVVAVFFFFFNVLLLPTFIIAVSGLLRLPPALKNHQFPYPCSGMSLKFTHTHTQTLLVGPWPDMMGFR